MSQSFKRIASLAIYLSTLFLSAGCATTPEISHAGRTPEEKEKLVCPGKLGGAADSRRWIFNFWNKQVVREDVRVGTVFMGDSITDFWVLPVYFTPSNGIMLNRGIGGDVASAMAKRFEADVVQLLPRNVIILGGTNDVTIAMMADKTDASETDIVRNVTASIESMMDQARAAGINTLVCSILPTNEGHITHAKGKPILTAINKNIEAACTARGCIYVDLATPLMDESGNLRKDLAYDGVHPNYAGYEVMTKTIKKAATNHGLRL